MANARNALYFEDYVLSIQYLNRVIGAKPYLSEPYYLRAYAKFSLDDVKGAKIDCDKALSINPFHADSYNLRGIIDQQYEQHEEAIEYFSKGLEFAPDHVNLLTNRANSKLSRNDYSGALDDYNAIIAKDPGSMYTYLNRGIARINLNDTIGALKDFSRVADKNPYMPSGFWYRAIVLAQQKEYAKALSDFDRVVELRPEDPGVYINRGITRYQLDDLRGAMDDLDKAIELEPRNRLALLDRGILRAEVGDLNRAVDDFSRALALDPSDLITLFNRSLVNIQLGNAKAALADLNIIIENKPQFAQGYMARAEAKTMLNDPNGAALDQGTAFKLEMQRRETQDVPNEQLVAKGTSPDQNDGAGDGKTKKKKETRGGSDEDISNYNKVAVLNDFETTDKKKDEAMTSIRGRVQNRDIFVDLEPLFGISLAQSDTVVVRTKYFDADLEKLNRKKLVKQRLQFSNAKHSNQPGSNYFFLVTELTDDMVQFGKNADMLFVRGSLFGMVMNFNQAINDFSESLVMQPNNKLALLNRALIRYRMVEAIKSMESEATNLPSDLKVQSRITAKTDNPQDKQPLPERIIDYDLVMLDLDKAIDLDPKFAMAYYNRGILYCTRKDFDAGLADFTKAIQLNPDFAEAYFNRGLTYIFMKKETEGIADLSKAGELGMYKAYNVIKRYSNSKK
jgi:tetratricopeptide (TPR) repeat protein